jgi:hypothetical protein
MTREIKIITDNVETTQAFYDDGSLMWERTMKIISKEIAEKRNYKNVIEFSDGRLGMQIGRSFKNHSNGKLAWELSHDENGKMHDYSSFRSNGERIIN